MPTKMTYFPLFTPTAMPSQCLFEISGRPYQGNTVTFEQWAELKPKSPNGVLPIANMPDGGIITESGAIGRTIAGAIGLLGKGKDYTTSEMLVGMGSDLHAKIMKIVPTVMTIDDYGRKEKAAFEAGKEDVLNFVQKFQPFLLAQGDDGCRLKSSRPGDRFTSSGLSFGEVDLFCKLFCYVNGPFPEIAQGDLGAFYARMHQVPGIQAVIAGKSKFGSLNLYLLAPPA